MKLKTLNDIVQYLETVQRSRYELTFDSVPEPTDPPGLPNQCLTECQYCFHNGKRQNVMSS